MTGAKRVACRDGDGACGRVTDGDGRRAGSHAMAYRRAVTPLRYLLFRNIILLLLLLMMMMLLLLLLLLLLLRILLWLFSNETQDFP